MATILGLLLGITGIGATAYFARKAREESRERRRLEWADLEAAANDLGKCIKRDVKPVAIVTPGLCGATFANLLADHLPDQPPVFVGISVWKDDPHGSVQFDDTIRIETGKWLVFIPCAITRYTEGDILILDDFVMSGDFLERLRAALISAGIKEGNIHSVAIAATGVAIKSHKAPDYHWWTAESDDFYFPWGKAR